jgi:hypothetical protein
VIDAGTLEVRKVEAFDAERGGLRVADDLDSSRLERGRR